MKTRSPAGVNRVLVTGGAGYLGSVVVAQLLDCGLRVRVLDSLLFGDESLDSLKLHANCEFIRGDVRDIESVVRAMTGCDAAIHLAGIVGDDACEANRQLAIEVNGAATRMLADVAPRCGIRRFLFASSCSVYGSRDTKVRESSKVRPLSLYAETKVDSEKILLAARTRRFAPTVLRLGTLFGLSDRMRFDLVVNLLTGRAMSTGRITIKNGWHWRPFLHVRDAARAFLTCLESPAAAVSGEVFNVGSHFLNMQIKELGEIIARLIPDTMVTEVLDATDRRTYRASFDKIECTIGFSCRETLETGVREVSDAIRACEIIDLSVAGLRNQMRMGGLGAVLGNQPPASHRLAVLANATRNNPAAAPIKAGASTSAARS